jgi:hypothetical protein
MMIGTAYCCRARNTAAMSSGRVCSDVASFTACGVALSMQMDTGRPWRSATAMI